MLRETRIVLCDAVPFGELAHWSTGDWQEGDGSYGGDGGDNGPPQIGLLVNWPLASRDRFILHLTHLPEASWPVGGE